MIRILAHNAAQTEILGKFQGVILQMQNHLSASRQIIGRLNGVGVFTARTPDYAFAAGCTARTNFNLTCHHKSTVKTHTKLPNQLRIGFLIAGKVCQELCGP